ncbi:hydroxymethylbilane synthase [Pseudohyphozyma bogoriensis]|nr:hydroxymethylbilane synthase [Pseudohyphozyma bogoriensis]
MLAVQSPSSPHLHPVDERPLFVPPSSPSTSTSSLHHLAQQPHQPVASTSRGSVFVLGTRASKLAMVQTNIVKAALEARFPEMEVRIFAMTTTGDNNTSQPLYLLGGKALWTKELEVELLEGRVDAIVHSLKDVPTEFPPGCELGAILEREDPSDALVVKAGLEYTSLDQFPEGSVIGTSSVRRVAQLRKAYPHLKFADVRGLVQTRLRKLDDPESSYTALILATAGLIRMGLADRITARVTSPALYHAVGQGAIGVEMRSGDPRAAEIVGSLECWKTGWTTRAERSMLSFLEGGCSVPVGAESFLVEEVDAAKCPIIGSTITPTSPKIDAHYVANGISNGLPLGHPARRTSPHDPHSATLTLTGTITSLAGTSSVVSSITRVVHSIKEAEALGADVAKELIVGGGRKILEELSRHVKEVGGEEGKEIPFESNRALGISPINTAPSTKSHHTFEPKTNGTAVDLAKVPVEKSPHRTVFGEAATCPRPAGW